MGVVQSLDEKQTLPHYVPISQIVVGRVKTAWAGREVAAAGPSCGIGPIVLRLAVSSWPSPANRAVLLAQQSISAVVSRKREYLPQLGAVCKTCVVLLASETAFSAELTALRAAVLTSIGQKAWLDNTMRHRHGC